MINDKELEKQKKRMQVIREFNACGMSCEQAARAFKAVGRLGFDIKSYARLKDK